MPDESPLIRLVDDNPDLLASLSFLLQCEGYETQAHQSAEHFLEKGDLERFGAIVLDVRMPGKSGLELQRELARRGCALPVIFLSAHGDVPMAVGAMECGARDFLEKPVDPPKLLAALARCLEEERARRFGALAIEEEIDRADTLTEQEEKILRAVASGLTSRQIAERQGISRRTVEHHRAAGIAKIGFVEPAAVAAYFARVDAWKKARGVL